MVEPMRGKHFISVFCSMILITMLCMPVTSSPMNADGKAIDNSRILKQDAHSQEPQDISSVYFAKTGPELEHTPSIIQAENGTFFMAYEKGDAATWYFTINILWSPDGIDWYGDNIIADSGSGGYGNRHPTLIQRHDGDLQVVYLSDRAGAYSDFEIYTSISPDGETWTEHGPLAVDGPAINPFIIKCDDGTYAVSYQRYGASPSSRNGAYFASSADGLSWTSGTQVSTYALPRLMKAQGGDYLMTYQGGTTGVDFEIRYKTSSDGAAWSGETILTATGNSHDSFPMQLANGSYMIFFASSIGGGGYDLYRKWSPDMAVWSDDEYLETNNFRFDTEPHPCQVAGNQSFLLSWGYESSGTVGGYEDVDLALMWIEDFTYSQAQVSLESGWNLVSLPIEPADKSVSSVLLSIAGKYNTARAYDPLDSADHWKMYRPSGPAAFNDLGEIDRTMGLWIDATEPCTLTVTGTPREFTNITLRAGWNLVGYPSTVDRTAEASLAGTGADMVAEFQSMSPYISDTTDLGTITMTQGGGYWVHVPADTIWSIDNLLPIPAPYPIFGYVQLYDGTAGGGYSPLASSGGATIEATWWNPLSGWESTMGTISPTGQYSLDIMNYLDGGIVYLNATFDAPYSNNGYNYTYIDVIMGMSMQNVVCGVPYDVWIVQPFAYQMVSSGAPFIAEYWIVDRDGALAQGYFTFTDGPFEWFSLDPMFVPPPFRTFEGTTDFLPGIGSEILTLYEPNFEVYIDVVEGPMGGNNYLTPWGAFYIDSGSSMNGWLSDSAFTFVEVV